MTTSQQSAPAPTDLSVVHGRLEGHPDHLSLGLYFIGALNPDTTKSGKIDHPGRPASVRLCGPLGGAVLITNPDRLRYEAGRLNNAARRLELEQAAPGEPIPLDLTQEGA